MDRFTRLSVVAVLVAICGAWGVWTGRRPAQAVNDPALNRQMYQAVEQYLTQVHVPRQDMPKQVLDVKLLSPGRYQVHMQMVVGEAWFEVRQDGNRWQVRGLNQPTSQAGLGSSA